ncbi:MAG: hypothetical protein QME46_07960 [Thermoanaerobacteraceae bacterium]|nr:hypothetical protein [Thermoanaerobacteraceae bacterium]
MDFGDFVQIIIVIVTAAVGFLASARKKDKKVDEIKKSNVIHVNEEYYTAETKSRNFVAIDRNVMDLRADESESSIKADESMDSYEIANETEYLNEEQNDILAFGFNTDELVKAVIYSEILTPPKAFRRFRRGFH